MSVVGDGVNIAARLERVCQREGVSVSLEPLLTQVKNKLPLGYQFLGEQTVKNIL